MRKLNLKEKAVNFFSERFSIHITILFCKLSQKHTCNPSKKIDQVGTTHMLLRAGHGFQIECSQQSWFVGRAHTRIAQGKRKYI